MGAHSKFPSIFVRCARQILTGRPLRGAPGDLSAGQQASPIEACPACGQDGCEPVGIIELQGIVTETILCPACGEVDIIGHRDESETTRKAAADHRARLLI